MNMYRAFSEVNRHPFLNKIFKFQCLNIIYFAKITSKNLVCLPRASTRCLTLVGIEFTSSVTLVIEIFSHSWIYWRRTSLLAAFSVHFQIVKSRMCQIYSIGFIPGDWLGHQSFCMPFSWCQACAVCVEWQGALSSIKGWWFLSIWALAKIGRRPSLSISMYLAEFMRPSHITFHHAKLHPKTLQKSHHV